MTLKLIIAPATEPVSLAEAKLQCKVDHDADDTLITSLIIAARQQAEHELGRPLITQTWEQVLDAFPPVELDLGKPAVLSIVSVKYTDLDGVEQTLADTAYTLDAEGHPCWLLPALETEWPQTLDTVNAVRVRFTCGYGAAASAVPELIKLWMRLQIGQYYANREAAVMGSIQPLPGLDRLLDAQRIWRA